MKEAFSSIYLEKIITNFFNCHSSSSIKFQIEEKNEAFYFIALGFQSDSLRVYLLIHHISSFSAPKSILIDFAVS